MKPMKIVQKARDINRATTKEWIDEIFDDFIELKGDRFFADDAAIIGGIARLKEIPVTVIGMQKGHTLKENIERNFGQVHPEGYRKSLRLMKQAEKLISEGADIIDVGGESTRPGHIQITSEEEISRVVPIIEKISKNLDTIISIDTYKYDVAEEAIKAGANIINDIWGLQYDKGEMAELVKKSNLPIIVMHNQNDEIYSKDIMLSLREFFEKTYKIADKYGIDRDKIILDPGLGFGKNAEQNIEVLSRLNELKDMGPILLGASKKRFIGKLLNDLPFDERVEGTVATTVIGIEKGVDIVRVHNVLENKRACLVADGIYRKRG